MKGRAILLGVPAGIGAVQGLAQQPAWLPGLGLFSLAGILFVAAVGRRAPRVGTLFLVVLLFALSTSASAGYAAWRAQLRLADVLDPQHENLVTRLTVQVTSLATGDDEFQRFEARVVSSPVPGVPERLWVGWPAVPPGRVPEIVPGDVISAALVLRRPHGLANPRSFDAEAWMFERGLRARATVRGAPVLFDRPAWAGFATGVQRLRHQWRAALRHRLGDARYGAVIIALALGDQASVAADDWEVFSRTGIIHLVSISGMHVTLLAGLAGGAALWGWKRARWRGLGLAERLPAQVAGAVVALLVAWLYCLVAGWGVPAQRTFFMLAVVGTASILRLPISASRLLPLAAAAVLLLDPWAMLSPGFWLSFGAVAVLMLLGTGRWAQPQPNRTWRVFRTAALVQGAMTLGLVPLLALQFHEVSLASPLANALAIPVVSFVVTPLALLGMLLAPWPGAGMLGGWLAQAAEHVFRWMMWPIQLLSEHSWATWPVAAPPWPLVGLAIAGVVYAVLPRGLPWRSMGWVFIFPLFVWQPARPGPGEWRLAVLDVGQGGGVVVQTQRHVLVFDTGPPFGNSGDAGDRVLWPYLRAQGVRSLDEVMISHADADHAGGLDSLLQRIRVRRLRAPESLPLPEAALDRAALAQAPCEAGQGWQWDGVVFRLVHPMGGANPGMSRNDLSCVLQIQGWWHSALLPGDIEIRAERALLVRDGANALRSEVVLMPHHGSLTSSSPDFVQAVGANHAVAQAAYLSRFGHPRPAVMARWAQAGALVHATADTGAMIFRSDARGLTWQAQRVAARRYWHHPGP